MSQAPSETIDDTIDNDDVDASKKALKRWTQEIRYYETRASEWETKSRKIIRRYKDNRGARDIKAARYNILWSNVQTTLPFLISRTPKPDIERRFRDYDELGRCTAMVLERSADFFMNEVFTQSLKQAVLDRLLSGRGTVWVRYEPHFKDAEIDENQEVAEGGEQVTDDVEAYEVVSDEATCFDYVHWEDFGHTFGRTWDEVKAGWRKVYMDREELKERFGDEVGAKIPLDYTPTDIKDAKIKDVIKKATIYEIWCKTDKKVTWLHKDYEEGVLDEKDDPLELQDFWPFPRPLFATLANDDCIPVPDYIEYQDQALELDEITSRITSITKSIKVAGIYDSSAQGVQRLLVEGVQNTLIPVEQWAAMSEKGGLAGVMELLPMQDILQTLLGLYEAREKVKGDLYEITGMSDIIRGVSDPRETAAAQDTKAGYGNMRLSSSQDDVKRFARDLVKISAEIIAKHFSIDTIKRISGIKLFTMEEKQAVMMQGQQQPGMPPPMPLPPDLAKMDKEDLDEMMEEPTWEEVEQLLKSENLLAYKIDIQTDSTIAKDQDKERDDRVQFLKATGDFLQSAMQNTNPDLAPLLGKLLQFGVRGFPVGKELESAFEVALKKLERDAQNPQHKPDPAMAKVQGDLQIAQQRLQADTKIEQQKSQDEQKRLQMQAQVDAHQGQVDAEVEKFKIELQGQMDMARTKIEAETKIIVATIQAKTQLQTTAMSTSTDENGKISADADGNITQKTGTFEQLMGTVVDQLQQSLQGIQAGHQQMANSITQAMAKPKQLIRDQQGNITGVQ